MKFLPLIPYLLLALITVPANAAKADQILVFSPGQKQTALRAYSSNGIKAYEAQIDTKESNKVISGFFSPQAYAGVLTGEDKNRVFKIYKNGSGVAAEINLTNEPVNTIFAADLNNSGYSDLVVISHKGAKATASVYYDPGFGSGQAFTYNLPVQGLYYSPAIAGTANVGIFVYNPKDGKTKKRSGKKKKKVKGAGVTLLDNGFKTVKTFKMSKAADGQIHPFSADGACGFAIQSGTKLKTYNSEGKAFKDVSLSSDAPAVIGNFSGGGATVEIINPNTNGVRVFNVASGSEIPLELKDLPNMQAQIDAEIARLDKELIDAYNSGASFERIDSIREELQELLIGKGQVGAPVNVAGRLNRLFTGGAGAVEGQCDQVDETPNDGYGGFLVKNGDYSGSIVILTPGGKNYIDGELVKFGSYKVIQKLKDSGYGNPDSNGFRKHFRGNGTVQSIGKFIFRAKLESSYSLGKTEKHCWHITRPSARID